MTSGSDYVYMPVSKMEPQSPSVARVSRKRNLSQVSWSSSSSVTSTMTDSKKPKKYQLDPSSDPTVRNAIAAKANREKKKKEEMELKSQNEKLKTENAQLAKQLEESVERQNQLVRMLEEAQTRNSGANVGPFPEVSIGSFFQSVMGEVANIADIPLEVNNNFEDIDTSPFDYDEMFPSISPDKLAKIVAQPISPIDDCLAMFNNTDQDNDPLLLQPYNQPNNADLCQALNQRMQNY